MGDWSKCRRNLYDIQISLIFRGGADFIGRRKPLGHPQAKISTYICKVAMESRKKKEVSGNREIRRYQEDY